MAVEIEVKILEISVPEIVAKLSQIGAKLQSDRLLQTFIYDFPDRKLLAQKSYLRLRNDEEGHWKCTYKRPSLLLVADAKVREELELKVDSQEIAEQILVSLGMQRILYLEKKRRHYVFEDIVFDLDELPQIPPFLEIEAGSADRIYAAIGALGLSESKIVTWGPKDLLAHYGINLDKIQKLTF